MFKKKPKEMINKDAGYSLKGILKIDGVYFAVNQFKYNRKKAFVVMAL